MDPLPTKLTVEDVVTRYLTDGTRDLSPTTLHRYNELWKIHAQPIAKRPIAQLRKAQINALYGALQSEERGRHKPLAGRTVLHLHRVLHRAFKWAVAQDIIGFNLFANITPPKAAESEARALTLDEAALFFNVAKGTTFEAFFMIALQTGARRGELIALRWDAIDMEVGCAMIRASLASTRATKGDRRNGAAAFILKAPKSGKSRRVPLDPDVIAILRRIRAAQAADKLANRALYRDNGFVFCDKFGRPYKLDAPTKSFRGIADTVGLGAELTLHSLRHTFASWSLASGGDITSVQRVLGHSVPSTTLNLYGHAIEGGQERAVEAASDTLRRVQARPKIGTLTPSSSDELQPNCNPRQIVRSIESHDAVQSLVK